MLYLICYPDGKNYPTERLTNTVLCRALPCNNVCLPCLLMRCGIFVLRKEADMEENENIAERLINCGSLSLSEYERLIEERTPEIAAYLAERADKVRREYYGNSVYIRGLIEISNICKNDCYYCGIRKSNRDCSRYRLTKEDILACCDEGYSLGLRTFVLQGGEDGYYTDSVLAEIISEIKSRYPDCAVTLSLGERSYESYRLLKEAGADRYLLRHETADEAHYS